jgi:hypothetical protein
VTAIKGQPATKPQSVPKPVPGAEAAEADADFLNSFDAEDLAFQSSFGDSQDLQTQSPPQTEAMVDPNSTAGQVIGTAAEYLPTVGGLVGGIAGGVGGTVLGAGVGGIPGSIAGAALGGAGGQAYRELIETQILGKQPKSSTDVATDIAVSGATEGASQAIGGLVMKGLGKIGSTALKYGDDALKALKGAVGEAKNVVEEPVTKMIFNKATSMTPQQSGDAVKSLLVNNIKGKYAPFVKAYGELDEIGKALPLKDEARLGLTKKVREWAASELGGDDYRVVKKFVDDLDAADNGLKLRNVISQIGDAKSTAYQSGATQQGRTLKLLQEKANDFMESETTKLASRIANGKAAPEEIGFMNQLLQTRGIQEASPEKYAKSLAKDYLSSLGKVKKDYAGFKTFLEDVAEQTKTKISNKGPVSFLESINEVPSEKLIEKMFDPKNAKALSLMKQETPEVFEEVSKARVKNLLEKSSLDGTLDLKTFQKEVMKLPPDTRKVLFSPEDVKIINKISLSPKLDNLSKLEKKLDSKMLGYIQEISTIVGKKTPQAVKAPMRQAIGNIPARGLVETGAQMLPQKEELPRTVDGLGE